MSEHSFALRAEALRTYVWYSPEWDEIILATKTDGYLVKDAYGEKHIIMRIGPSLCSKFLMSDFYCIGEFD